jgi:TP901 family phage tail tape measure protein
VDDEILASLRAVVGADISGFQRGMETVRGEMGGVGSQMQQLGGQISGFGAGLTALTTPFLALGGVATNTFMGIEDRLAEIQARTGLTAGEMENLNRVAGDLAASATSPFNKGEVLDAFLELLASGQTFEEAMGTISSVLDGASANATQLGRTADIVTDSMAAFGLSTEDASNIVETLTKAAGSSSASFETLGQGLANAAGQARLSGLSFEDTVAILSIFSENGIKGAEAGTQLRSMLQNMYRDTDEATGAWARLGIELKDAQGNIRPLSQVFAEVRAATAGMSQYDQQQIFTDIAGSYGILGFTALASSISIDEMRTRMDEAAGTADVVQGRVGTLSAKFESLTGTVQVAMEEAIKPFANDVLKPLTDDLIVVAQRVTEWARANPELTKTIATVVSTVAGLGTAVFAVGQVISFMGTVVALLSSPVALIVGAIAALGAAFVTNFGGIRDAVQPVLDDLGARLVGLWNEAQPALESLRAWFTEIALPAISNFIQTTAIPAVQGFVDILGGIWEQVQPALASVYDWFVTTALPAVGTFITETAIPAVQEFINILGGIWSNVQDSLGNIHDWFVANALPAIQGAIEKAQPVVEGIRDVIVGIWDAVSPGLGQLAEWFTTSALPGIVSYIRDVAVAAFNEMKEVLTVIWEGISPTLEKIYDWFVVTALPEIQRFIEGPFTTAIDNVTTTISNIWNAVEPAISAFRDGVIEAIGMISDIVQGLIDKWDELVGKVTGGLGAYGGIGENVNAIANSGASLGDIVTAAGNAILSQFGFRADGGSVKRGEKYIVGEEGPEVFVPGADGTILPNGFIGDSLGQTALAMLPSGGGRQVVNNFYIDDEQLVDQLVQIIERGFGS